MIERYRGVEFLAWDPSPGINCIVGPGDAGKTTILAAIELLFAPWQPIVFEFDYWQRSVADGFCIRAVLVDLPPDFIASFRVPPLHGWRDGELLDLPDPSSTPALVVLARGLPDLDVEHVLVDASGNEHRFSLGQRRELMTTRLQWERTDAELRLGRGSLLQEQLGGEAVRSALTGALAAASERLQLPKEVADRLKVLGERYATVGLPRDLQLGLQSPRRESLMGMLGLLQGSSHTDAIPLALAGAGTRRFAAFELAATLRADAHVVLIDEPEIGLEPYRQRRLVHRIRELIGERGQAFLTTHSPAVLGGLRSQEVVRLASKACPLTFPPLLLDRLMKEDPEALLARLPVLCEGPTEAGLLGALLPQVAGLDGRAALDALGIRLVTRSGQPSILKESNALADVGVSHGLFVDNEATHGGMRARAEAHTKVVLGVWRDVCNIEEAVAKWLPLDRIEALLALVLSFDQRQSIEGLLQAIGDKAKHPGRKPFRDLIPIVGEDAARSALGQAMNSGGWFKSEERASELAKFLTEGGIPEKIRETISAFWDRLKALVLA